MMPGRGIVLDEACFPLIGMKWEEKFVLYHDFSMHKSCHKVLYSKDWGEHLGGNSY